MKEVPTEEDLIEGCNLAIIKAIEALHQKGISTYHMIDGELIEITPQGERIKVKSILISPL